jgi:sugar phosphate permease
MIGPYGFLTNVISLDLGGKCGSATAAGIVDCIGYLGAIFSGWAIGSMVERTGSWKIAFLTLAGVAVVTAIATLAYWLVHEVFAKKKILEDASDEPIVDGDVTTQVENFPTKK